MQGTKPAQTEDIWLSFCENSQIINSNSDATGEEHACGSKRARLYTYVFIVGSWSVYMRFVQYWVGICSICTVSVRLVGGCKYDNGPCVSFVILLLLPAVNVMWPNYLNVFSSFLDKCNTCEPSWEKHHMSCDRSHNSEQSTQWRAATNMSTSSSSSCFCYFKVTYWMWTNNDYMLCWSQTGAAWLPELAGFEITCLALLWIEALWAETNNRGVFRKALCGSRQSHHLNLSSEAFHILSEIAAIDYPAFWCLSHILSITCTHTHRHSPPLAALI